jgi:hypothetical protein
MGELDCRPIQIPAKDKDSESNEDCSNDGLSAVE